MGNTSDVYGAIVAADQAFMNAFHQGDAAAVASLYAEDGQFMPPNGGFVTGRQSIQETFQSLMNSGVRDIKLETLEVDGYGDTASEVGTYVLEGDGGQVVDQGKFLVIWKQEGGQWKLYRDMINTSLPAQH